MTPLKKLDFSNTPSILPHFDRFNGGFMELNGIVTVVFVNFAPLLNGENSKPAFFQGSHTRI